MNESQSNPSLYEHIPAEAKAQLMEFAERLPNRAAERDFLVGVFSRTEGLLNRYENTIVYSAFGWAVGAVVEHFTHIPLPTILGGGFSVIPAGEISPLIGAILGFREDKKKQKERAEVVQIITEELAKANQRK